MGMTVKTALREKAKLVAEGKALAEIIKAYNSIEEGNPRRYSILETISKLDEVTNRLVELKSKIHKANMPVYDKIFLMAELKGQVKILKAMPIEEGKTYERYGSVLSVKSVEINVAERNSMVKAIETKIEKLQDELDFHNATTEV